VDRRNTEQYWVALVLLGLGVVLWAVTFAVNRALHGRRTYVERPEDLEKTER
jgi:basic amino acid/polyamine antiporter, APA family